MTHCRARCWLITTVALVAGACAGGAASINPASQPTALFRHVNLGARGTLTLGTAFRSDGIATRESDSTYALVPGTFGGAESIKVLVDADRTIYAFEFIYALGTSYRAQVAEYTQTLGTPTESTAQRTMWADRATRFEILTVVGGATTRVRARMSDLRR